METHNTDFLVVGSGLAGLMSALHLADHGKVLVLTKSRADECNTHYAQGGIACVVDVEDSFDEHVADTLEAGAGLCNEAAVRSIVGDGPARIRDLERFGLAFARSPDSPSGYDLGKEGGHSRRRILHCGDHTGREVERVLLSQVRAHPQITVREHCMAIDLITTGWMGLPGPNRCVGIYFYDGIRQVVEAVRTPCTVLATGGGGQVYLHSTNPPVATADGIAIAWRAGLPIANLEFVQFHPTTLYHAESSSFLISEAVRGESAVLVSADGRSFTEQFDPRGSLAPRDIVARAIDSEMKASGAPCVYLDIRHKTRAFLETRFPTIYSTLLRLGIDMARDLIPVVPSAHYTCGGVQAAVDGRTEMPGLVACGEVACTGLHGANRLASNSLLEALVCSARMAQWVQREADFGTVGDVLVPDWHPGDAVPSDEEVVVEHNWSELRTCMWDYVGIVRSDKRLDRATRRMLNLRREIREYYLDYLVSPKILELRNIADVGQLVVRSAATRRESRGLHYTLDCPGRDDAQFAKDSVIRDAFGGHPARPLEP